tara:strand:+ start:126 stop:593 length:468 start_codon:yes stop_codon:yes gene_type:complete
MAGQLPQDDNNRIDINLIAMLLWQSLLTGVAVAVSHMNWYLPDSGPGEMGAQYGLVAFGFLCLSMVLFHVGGIRDSLSMRAEFSQEARYDKWHRNQQRLQERRLRKDQMVQNYRDYGHQLATGPVQRQDASTFGLPNAPEEIPGEDNSNNGEQNG